MQIDLPETTSKIGGPLVRQFSVFLPNKVGAMLQIVKLLNAHATHVVALSISESTDAAIARRHRASIGTIVSEATMLVKMMNGRSLGTIEEFREKEAAGAQYEAASPDGSRPGRIEIGRAHV